RRGRHFPVGHVHGLPDADRLRHPPHRDRAPRDRAARRRRQLPRRGRRRHDRRTAHRRERDRGRPLALRGADLRAAPAPGPHPRAHRRSRPGPVDTGRRLRPRRSVVVPSRPVVPTALPALPHWEQTPADLPDAIRQVKAALRARIAASGRTVEDVFAVVEDQIAHEAGEIIAAREHGEMVWPIVDYADIEAGTVPAGAQDRLRRRGCLVGRGHFDREQALSWDRGIVDYVEGNGFFENYRGPGDDFFGSVGSRPEIYPIYWSPAQMQARQSDRMARVQTYLNSFWKHESGGV